MGRIIDRLLEAVIEDPVVNERVTLLALAREFSTAGADGPPRGER